VIAAVAAMSARETFRLRMRDLGNDRAQPVPAQEYERLRTQAMASKSVA